MGVSQNKGNLFGLPIIKDFSILGSILGSAYLGALPYNTRPPILTILHLLQGPSIYYMPT